MAKLLVLNLGSTSTKVALYHDESVIASQTLRHTSAELAPYPTIMDQTDFRKGLIESWLLSINVKVSDMDLLVVRGGIVKPIKGGIYKITEPIYNEVHAEIHGSHISNVGMCIGYRWAQETGLDVVFVNAPMTDEFQDVARVVGLKGHQRRSGFHALNQKEIALQYATSIHKSVDELNLIVAHLGGGISIGAHHHGRVIDVNNPLDGEGPMSPERAGALPSRVMYQVMAQYHNDPKAVQRVLVGKGGMVSLVGSNDMRDIMAKASTDPEVNLAVEAMIYQIAKEIGAMATVLHGQVDQILITGGLAHDASLIDRLRPKVSWIAGISVYPGEDELGALARGALRYLRGEEKLQSY
jgi:butyrate kinase